MSEDNNSFTEPPRGKMASFRGAQYLFIDAYEGQASAPNDFEESLNSADIIEPRPMLPSPQ